MNGKDENTEEPTLAPPKNCMKDQSSNEAAGWK